MGIQLQAHKMRQQLRAEFKRRKYSEEFGLNRLLNERLISDHAVNIEDIALTDLVNSINHLKSQA